MNRVWNNYRAYTVCCPVSNWLLETELLTFIQHDCFHLMTSLRQLCGSYWLYHLSGNTSKHECYLCMSLRILQLRPIGYSKIYWGMEYSLWLPQFRNGQTKLPTIFRGSCVVRNTTTKMDGQKWYMNIALWMLAHADEKQSQCRAVTEQSRNLCLHQKSAVIWMRGPLQPALHRYVSCCRLDSKTAVSQSLLYWMPERVNCASGSPKTNTRLEMWLVIHTRSSSVYHAADKDLLQMIYTVDRCWSIGEWIKRKGCLHVCIGSQLLV